MFPVLLSLIIMLLFTTIFPSAVAVSVKLTVPDTSTICDKSMNQTFCESFMKSTAGISTADLAGAGGIILDVSSRSAAETEDYIKTQLAAGDPKLAEAYKKCLENYRCAVSSIADAKASLASKDYEGMNLKASSAQSETDTCNEAETDPVPERSRYMCNVLDIVLIIANKLQKG
ncbi:unnamed protein product [Linum tenue]|uniref:Pectinesterase inhibitor domain-containing protein n=1 Tax=Linum tenue TaxID=586396 RepID=A0AAV0KGX3_9ROSI|nr:unnamed protein product [Linum tenue]